MSELRILVFSSLFPSDVAPTAGVFIRERMFRVARKVPLVVVAPQPWSPLDGLARLFRSTFRPQAKRHETMDGIEVYRPRYVSIPRYFKTLDGWLMALGARATMRKLMAEFKPTLIDAHFLYPDGYAAVRLAREAGLPCVVTLRGSKDEWLLGTSREPLLKQTVAGADRLIAVSEALKSNVAVHLGRTPDDVAVIGNGVDLSKFHLVDREQARTKLGIPVDAKVMISVGGLTENKGFHRVIDLLPALRKRIPGLIYLIVGGGTTRGDMRSRLEEQARALKVNDIVRFCGPQPHDALKDYYSAADIFVLATAFEGWANVFLEAMACRLPVVTTRVGGNPEVVSRADLGTLVPYWEPAAFEQAVVEAFERPWNREAIEAYARENSWEARIDKLLTELHLVTLS